MKRLAPLAFGAAIGCGLLCLADNPIIQTIYTADPAPLVHNGRVYLYTGHDEDKSTWFTMKDWRCFSSADMVNWTHHASPLAVSSFTWARADAWAGHVIERDGKFYFYVPVNRKGGGMSIGVAVADSPTGPFRDAIGKPLIAVGEGNIDPAAFIDDDGQAYLYWGNPTPKYVKLNRDMISFDEGVGIVEVPLTAESFGKRSKAGDKRATLYEEGPWPYKRNGLYYLVFAAGPIPEHIGYSTGRTATGPWTYRGVVMPTEGRSFTNHPGIIDFKGSSYFFYHNGALPGGGGFTRSVCVEQFDYNPDGTIPTIKMSRTGPNPVAHLNPFEKTEAETICLASGIETTVDKKGNVYVTDISDGDFIKVKAVDFGDKGAKRLLASLAATAEGSEIKVRIDSADGKIVGILKAKPTGEAEKWETQSTDVETITGVHDLYFTFTGGAINFDWWQFE
jgi:hypothetical protein